MSEKTGEPIKIVDLFCGAGGLSLGFEREVFSVVAALDGWPVAIETHKANLSGDAILADLSNVDESVEIVSRYAPAGIVGGPPCQDFSSAGNRVEGERAALTPCFARIVAKVRPTFFVMENVALAQRSESFAKAREIFKEAGYGITSVVLNASRCGVAQNRKRLFCCGVLGLEDDFAARDFAEAQSEKPTTIRDKYGDAFGFEYYFRAPRHNYCRAVFSIDEPAPTILGRSRPIPPNYRKSPKDVVPIDYPGLRPMTTRERATIQTFPEDFRFVGTKTEIEQTIGNAVPVELASFVARIVRKFVEPK